MDTGNMFNTPIQIVDANMMAGESKVRTSALKCALLGILAGAFIALGAEASSLAMHDIQNVGIARLAAGCVFPIGLMMIVFIGGELFTGDCLMMMDVLGKRITVLQMFKTLGIVFVSNLVGALVIVFLTAHCGQWNYSDGMLGAFTIKIAMGKISIAPDTAIYSGILCNILVCLAVLMAGSARDITGKIFAIFFPIMAFVVSGFEHCVANMYYIPAGIAAKEQYGEQAMRLYGYTSEQLERLNWGSFWTQIIPVTVGNMIGGMICVGGMLYMIHKSHVVNEPEPKRHESKRGEKR